MEGLIVGLIVSQCILSICTNQAWISPTRRTCGYFGKLVLNRQLLYPNLSGTCAKTSWMSTMSLGHIVDAFSRNGLPAWSSLSPLYKMTKKLRSTYLEQTQLVCAKNLETLDQLLRIGGRLWLQRMTLCLSCANLSIASRSELTKGLPFLLTQRRVWKSFWQGIPHVLMYVHYIYI